MSEKRESSVAAQAKPESGIARVHGTERGDEIYVYVGERGKGGVCVFGSRYGDRPQAERVAHAINSTHERICPYRAERDAALKANEALREGISEIKKSLGRYRRDDCISPGAMRGLGAYIDALLAGDSEAERGD
jgi:hypothetical protein